MCRGREEKRNLMILSLVRPCASGLLACWLISASAEAAPQFIAGTAPSQRPDAPVVTEVIKPEGWYAEALRGIAPPYPASLSFLEDQGNWFTPFNRPGMLPPYDLRDWHQDN